MACHCCCCSEKTSKSQLPISYSLNLIPGEASGSCDVAEGSLPAISPPSADEPTDHSKLAEISREKQNDMPRKCRMTKRMQAAKQNSPCTWALKPVLRMNQSGCAVQRIEVTADKLSRRVGPLPPEHLPKSRLLQFLQVPHKRDHKDEAMQKLQQQNVTFLKGKKTNLE